MKCRDGLTPHGEAETIEESAERLTNLILQVVVQQEEKLPVDK